MNNNYLIQLFDSVKINGKFSSRLKENIKSKDILAFNYIIDNFCWCKNFKEVYYCLINNINKQPICPICGKLLKSSYHNFCSKECWLSPIGQQIYWQKYKTTCNKKYDCDFYVQTNDFFNKRKKTFNEKYGVDWPQQLDYIKNKMKDTCNHRYGGNGSSSSIEVQEKIKKTTLKNFGVECILNLPEVKEKAHSIKAINKRFDTYLKNHKHCKSKIEKNTHEYLIKKFGVNDVIKEYFSEKYPFHCDFYIISLDLYIELNGHQSHGPHPFNPENNNDIMLLNKWNLKNFKEHPQYKKYIEVWTKRDPLKRKTAKENNLNYLEIFSIKFNIVKSVIEEYVKLYK